MYYRCHAWLRSVVMPRVPGRSIRPPPRNSTCAKSPYECSRGLCHSSCLSCKACTHPTDSDMLPTQQRGKCRSCKEPHMGMCTDQTYSARSEYNVLTDLVTLMSTKPHLADHYVLREHVHLSVRFCRSVMSKAAHMTQIRENNRCDLHRDCTVTGQRSHLPDVRKLVEQ